MFTCRENQIRSKPALILKLLQIFFCLRSCFPPLLRFCFPKCNFISLPKCFSNHGFLFNFRQGVLFSPFPIIHSVWKSGVLFPKAAINNTHIVTREQPMSCVFQCSPPIILAWSLPAMFGCLERSLCYHNIFHLPSESVLARAALTFHSMRIKTRIKLSEIYWKSSMIRVYQIQVTRDEWHFS